MYRQLPTARSFRLLKVSGLHPGNGPVLPTLDADQSSFRSLTFEINTYDLSRHPPYVALSYTWDAPLETPESEREYGPRRCEELVLWTERGEEQLPVRRNLYEGLVQVIKSRSVEYLWADAICINQDSEHERSSRVMIMGSIFTRCQRVMVWLGKDESDLEDFKWIHETLLPVWKEWLIEHGVGPYLRSRWNDESNKERFDLDVRARWPGYCKYYSERRWFRRAWIVQEVALARQITVYSGSSQISWDDMALVAEFFQTNPPDLTHRRPSNNRPPSSEMAQLNAFRGMCQPRRPEGGLESPFKHRLEILAGHGAAISRWQAYFLIACIELRPYEARRMHDKIHAALGIVETALPTGFTMPIRPNYTRPAEELYTEVAYHFVRELPSLVILSCVEDRAFRRMHSLPSWVPDFSITYSKLPLIFSISAKWNASCAGPTASYPRELSHSALMLKGGYFATVDGVLQPMWISRNIVPTPEQETVQRLEFLTELFELCRDINAADPERRPHLKSLVATLAMDHFHSINRNLWHQPNQERQMSSGSANEVLSSFRSWVLLGMITGCVLRETKIIYDKCLVSLIGLIDQKIEEPSALPPESEIVELLTACDISKVPRSELSTVCKISRVACSEETAQKLQKCIAQGLAFARSFSFAHKDRRLYRTSRGHFGLGPPSIVPGDQVWMICDSLVPLVLRPAPSNEGRYELMGETYLHGFMHGEMLSTELQDRLGPVWLV